jgi:hypothetical protein
LLVRLLRGLSVAAMEEQVGVPRKAAHRILAICGGESVAAADTEVLPNSQQ